MKIGVPKEIKTDENRVGLTLDSVQTLTRLGHEVFVEKNAGVGIDYFDEDYIKAGAKIIESPDEIFNISDMIVKVKEPLPQEYKLLKDGQILFTYLHLAADKKLAEALCESGVVGVAYETVIDKDGKLPLLQPMSQVAGRMSIQVGARCLEKSAGGRGMLLGGVPGVKPANVIILGGGIAGSNAMQMALGAHADVTIFDTSLKRLAEIDEVYNGRVKTVYSNHVSVENHLVDADLVIGAVLIPGASAPKLVKKEHLKTMKRGSVLVDISIDQGGCFETSHPTTHSDPYFVVDDVVHYSVANMPGAVARTSAFALNNATMNHVLKLAENGLKALEEDKFLMHGVNTYKGNICHSSVASSLEMKFKEFKL